MQRYKHRTSVARDNDGDSLARSVARNTGGGGWRRCGVSVCPLALDRARKLLVEEFLPRPPARSV